MAQAKTARQGQGASQSAAADSDDLWLDMYRQMIRIRLFEEQVNDLYKTARMPGLAHLYSGEEGVAVAGRGCLAHGPRA